MGKYKKSPGVHSQDSKYIDIFIYGTLNDSLGTVKTANCYLIGTTVEGDLGYVKNAVEYVSFGSLLFVNYHLSIDDVITHPLGYLRVKFNIPELINRNLTLDSGGDITYASGGYKNCLRRQIASDLYNNGLMDLRGFVMPNEGLKPILHGSVFVDDVARIAETNNNIHLINEDGSVDVQIKGTFFTIIH